MKCYKGSVPPKVITYSLSPSSSNTKPTHHTWHMKHKYRRRDKIRLGPKWRILFLVLHLFV